MKQIHLVLTHRPGSVPITVEQAKQLFGDQWYDGEIRGHISWGLCHTIVGFRALATTNDWHEVNGITRSGPLHVFGFRKLTGVHESGTELEGRVSIGGKSYRGFTSSQLFELPDGHLINVATIHVCKYL